MITLYCQDARPVPLIAQPDPYTRPPRVATTVFVVEVLPVLSTGEEIRNPHLTAAVARQMREAANVYSVVWSRSRVDLLMESEMDSGAAEKATMEMIRSIKKFSEIEFQIFVEERPDRWSRRMRSMERMARKALAGRHQCQASEVCMCSFRGNVEPESESNRRGEVGVAVGKGGQL